MNYTLFKPSEEDSYDIAGYQFIAAFVTHESSTIESYAVMYARC